MEPGCGEGRVSLLTAPPMMASMEKLVRAEEDVLEDLDGGEPRALLTATGGGGVDTSPIELPVKCSGPPFGEV